ncbi:MAG TPA: endonuclease III [Dehalococcoidia bacterium]|nr:endonuclease III [Dehalococcoidia bacterium]
MGEGRGEGETHATGKTRRPHSPTARAKHSAPPIEEIIRGIHAAYGALPWRPHGDGITELILTILSQHTADTNSGKAFANLITLFPDWDSIRTASVAQIAEATRAAGLSASKAPRIKAALEQIKDERGDYDLRFLIDLPLEEARSWLTSLKGVGPKTAACVLMFALGRPALPVDTHVFRVSHRLGLLPPKATVEAAHRILESAMPAEVIYDFHVGLIKHGRHVCFARSPACAACVLNDICPSAFTFPKPGDRSRLARRSGATGA